MTNKEFKIYYKRFKAWIELCKIKDSPERKEWLKAMKKVSNNIK